MRNLILKMSNICKFEIFSYLQKFPIFMRWVWKIWVDHNKTDYGSKGGIAEVTNKLYKIASILHGEKSFQRANLLHFSYIFMVELHQNGQNLLARLHGNQILILKFWHLFSSFCIKRHTWCKFHQNLRHAVSSPYSKYFGAYGELILIFNILSPQWPSWRWMIV